MRRSQFMQRSQIIDILFKGLRQSSVSRKQGVVGIMVNRVKSRKIAHNFKYLIIIVNFITMERKYV